MSIELASRIDSAIKNSPYSKAEVARRLKVTPQAVNGWVKKGKISKETLIDLSNLIKVDPNYLLFGYGSDSNEVGIGNSEASIFLDDNEYDQVSKIASENGLSIDETVQMLFENGAKAASLDRYAANAEYAGHVDSWDDSTPLHDDEAEVPFFMDVELAAGIGGELAQENYGPKLRFSKSTLRKCGVQPENAACVKVVGNSMEPRLYDGDVVGVDTGDKRIRDGQAYAINHDGLLRIKLLYLLPKGALRIRSLNTEEYEDEIVPSEDRGVVSVIGRVFWSSSIWK